MYKVYRYVFKHLYCIFGHRQKHDKSVRSAIVTRQGKTCIEFNNMDDGTLVAHQTVSCVPGWSPAIKGTVQRDFNSIFDIYG